MRICHAEISNQAPLKTATQTSQRSVPCCGVRQQHNRQAGVLRPMPAVAALLDNPAAMIITQTAHGCKHPAALAVQDGLQVANYVNSQAVQDVNSSKAV